MNTSEKIRMHFRKDPSASPSEVAAKYSANVSLVYKLRKEEALSKATASEDTSALLTARGHEYGIFRDSAALMQGIKRLLADHAAKHDKTFADDQWEALEMIVHKIARIVNGNPDKVDSWQDIAGYATLIADRLQGNPR